jgi:hypothetical protein
MGTPLYKVYDFGLLFRSAATPWLALRNTSWTGVFPNISDGYIWRKVETLD